MITSQSSSWILVYNICISTLLCGMLWFHRIKNKYLYVYYSWQKENMYVLRIIFREVIRRTWESPPSYNKNLPSRCQSLFFFFLYKYIHLWMLFLFKFHCLFYCRSNIYFLYSKVHTAKSMTNRVRILSSAYELFFRISAFQLCVYRVNSE